MKAFLIFLLGIIGIVHHPVPVSNPTVATTTVAATSTSQTAPVVMNSPKTVVVPPQKTASPASSPVAVANTIQVPQTTVPQKVSSEAPVAVAPPKTTVSVKSNTLVDFNSISSDESATAVDVASKATGVPAAFLLTMLQQSSGSSRPCYVTDLKTGTMTSGSSMKSQDASAFSEIISVLKIDASNAPVSCKDGTIGLGFIPRTWISISESRARGSGSILNPWKPADVALEVAVFLGQAGGSLKSDGYADATAFNKTAACKAWSANSPSC